MSRFALLISAMLPLGACASTPDVTVQYYPAKSVTTLTLTQTVACTHDDRALDITNAIAAATEYSADDSKPPQRVRIRDLDNAFADAEIGFGLTDDGRLKSINATSTGQGEAILQAAISLGSALVPVALGASPVHGAGKPAKLAACATLENWAGGKATLTFTKAADLSQISAGDKVTLNDSGALVSDDALYARLENVLPEVTMHVVAKSVVPHPAEYTSRSAEAVTIPLQEISNVRLDFYSEGGGTLGMHRIGAKIVTIPGPGTYLLPIPKAALFGGEKFSLTLSDAGAITSIDYGKSTGAAGPLSVATSAVTAVTPSSPPPSP